MIRLILWLDEAVTDYPFLSGMIVGIMLATLLTMLSWLF